MTTLGVTMHTQSRLFGKPVCEVHFEEGRRHLLTTTRLILVRHGVTEANREMRYIGRRNDVLTAQGHMQARQLAEALASLPIVAIYSSPLERAYHTALPIAALHHLGVQIVDYHR